MVRVSAALRRAWGRDAGKLAWILCWIPIMLGIYSGAAEHAKIFRNDPRYTGLALLRNAEAHNTFAQIEANPATTYVIAEQNQLGNAWLAYHARKSKAYITAPMLGDIVLHPPGSLLPMVPPGIQNVAVVITSGIQSEAAGRIMPSIQIDNPQGFDADLIKKWYWMGKTMGIRIVRPFTDPPQAPYALTALASPGLGHPTLLRRIEVINSTTGERQEVVIRDTGPIGIPLMLAAGANRIQMTLIEPSSGFVTTPHDGRKLLVRLEDIQLRYRK